MRGGCKTSCAALCGLRFGAAAVLSAAALSWLWRVALASLGVEAAEQAGFLVLSDASKPLREVCFHACVAVFVSPVFEEILFRAVLQGWLAGLFRKAAPAVAATALVFAALHGSLVAFPPLLAVSVCCSLAYLQTNRLSAPIVAHMVVNVASVACALAQR